MKALRQLTASALLVLVLALPTFAGDMHFPVAPPSPPPPTARIVDQPASAPADSTPDVQAAELDPLTEISLLMLQGVLALF